MSGSSRARTVRGREHEVTLSVSFVQAVDPPEREPQFYESMRDGQRKRIYESLNPGHHFHLEYCPLPGEGGGRVYHTDVVTFGVASKVYTDQDVRVVKCWEKKEEEEGEEEGEVEGEEEGKEEGERLVHFGWRHRHTFKVTRPLLLELYDHVMEVRVWNTKDKLSARAQYDRPKAFRLPVPSKGPQLGEGDLPTTGQPAKLPVVSQDHMRTSKRGRRGRRRSNLNVATTEADSDDLNASIGEVASPLVSPGKAPTIMEEGKVEGGKEDGGGDTSLLGVALVPHPNHAPPTPSLELATTSLSMALQGLSPRKVRRLEAEAAEQARVAREGVAALRLRMSDLFAKRTSISAAIEQAVKDLKGFEVTVSLEGPLMPEHLLQELNPMTITVNSASGLPSTPIPHQELSERCEPVYVKYRFFSQPWQRTPALPHSPLVTWEDSHIILLGTIERELLVEYLRGPPLVMEVHDRDCRKGDPPLPSLFGREERDEVLGTHAFGTGLSKKSCGCDGRSHNPCGIARVDLSGLLDGQRMVEVTVPITNSCSLGEEEEEVEGGVKVGPLGRVLPNPLPTGDYIQSQSELTVTVELTHALTVSLPSPSHTLHSTSTRKPELQQRAPKPSVCPFNRLVYVISSEGTPLVEQILTLVNEINTRALGLHDVPSNMLPAALSTYKLTKDQMCSVGCDVITGFHVEDWEQHVVVLEGVRGEGVRRVWEELPHHPTQAEGLLRVFYNSDFAFSHRLYGSLDVDLPRVLLYQPLSELLQQSMLYVRGSIPRRCFCALVRLSQLALVSEMGDLTRNELFPTAEEVVALGLQFAVPLTFEMEDEHVASPLESSLERPRTPPLEERHRRHRGSKQMWEPLDLSNPVFEKVLQERGRAPTQDFIRRNILHSQILSKWSAQRRALRRTQSRSEDALSRRRTRSLSEGALSHEKKLESPLHPVHNYSTQTLNSTELAKAMLREQLARDPTHRYTYCQHYHSMTVVPIDMEAEQRAKRLEARQRWRTKEGFVYPGVPTSAQSSSHPQKPDLARTQDLKEPFKDNLLHGNTLKPTVERLHFSWQNRSGDFERWTRPPTSLGPLLPPTIHLAGESRARELWQSREREKEEWKRRLVVADTCFHIHRKAISTELHTSGPKASAQTDKLGGLLKDSPQKYSLRGGGLRLDSVPALDVVRNPSLDSRLNVLCVEGEREEEGGGGAYHPGPFNTRSWKLDSNVIPVHVQRGSQSNKRGAGTHHLPHSQDFRLYYHIPTVASRRLILPLREDEKAPPLFTAQTHPPLPLPLS